MKFLSPTFAGSFGQAVRRNGSRLAILLAALFVSFAIPALAQEATILGTVTDPSGAAVPNATITITNTDTGVARSLPTNSDGQYVAPDLIIGHYNVRVKAAGFKGRRAEEVSCSTSVTGYRIDFKLVVGSVQETMTVEANAVACRPTAAKSATSLLGNR
jgi:hypothetical protein